MGDAAVVAAVVVVDGGKQTIGLGASMDHADRHFDSFRMDEIAVDALRVLDQALDRRSLVQSSQRTAYRPAIPKTRCIRHFVRDSR